MRVAAFRAIFAGMILSDRELRARLESGEIVIETLDDPELQIQPASIDLRLGDSFVAYRLPHVSCIDARDPESVEGYTHTVTIAPGEAYTLHPGEFVLGSTKERVRVPHDLVARVEGRSSIGRLAVVVHATAGFIDPGFEGRITLELSNLGRVAMMRPCDAGRLKTSSLSGSTSHGSSKRMP